MPVSNIYRQFYSHTVKQGTARRSPLWVIKSLYPYSAFSRKNTRPYFSVDSFA